MKVKTDCHINFCFLKAEKNSDGLRPVLSADIESLGITYEQAKEVCDDLYNKHDSIAAWVTYSEKEINSGE